MGPQDVLAFLKSAGWVSDRLPSTSEVKDRIDGYRNPLPDGIKGCIERDGVLWRFNATVNIDDRSVEKVDVRFSPVCPDCRAELDSDTVDLLGSRGPTAPYGNRFDTDRHRAMRNRPIWVCAACDFSDSRDTDTRSEVQTLAQRDVERIVESRDKQWSLPALVSRMNEVDSRSVWEAYADVVDDDHVSTQCFH